MNVHFAEVIPGRGQLDYETYLREIANLTVDAPLMLEHLKTAEEYQEGRDYIRRVGDPIGVPSPESAQPDTRVIRRLSVEDPLPR